jgi:hypothetical protein
MSAVVLFIFFVCSKKILRQAQDRTGQAKRKGTFSSKGMPSAEGVF